MLEDLFAGRGPVFDKSTLITATMYGLKYEDFSEQSRE